MNNLINKKAICIVTRHDIFPPIHGGAVKTVSTAKSLSASGADVFLLIAHSDKYFKFENGDLKVIYYPGWTKLIPSFSILSIYLLTILGVPRGETWMYSAIFDINLWIKVLVISFIKKVNVLQSEFPGFAFSFFLPKLFLGITTSLVEHNIEFERLSETTQISKLGKTAIKLFEIFICRMVDIVVTVSENDKQILIDSAINENKIFVIPSGVDIESFKGVKGNEIKRKFNLTSATLIFHGALQYKPNKDAVKAIATQILPGLRSRGKNVKILIVGMNPPIEYSDPDIIFTGAVEHIPEYIKAADIAIVPITAGGGTRLKILEYFAAEVPVVSTTKGAEGLDVSNDNQILIANTTEEFIDRIIYLMDNSDFRSKLSESAYDFVKKYDWRNISQNFLKIYFK